MKSSQITYPLGDCISLFGGGTPSKDKPEYWNGDIPWASVKDLKTMSLNATQDSISALGLANSASKIVKADSIIIATRMAVGRVAITEIDVAINQDLRALIVINGIIRVPKIRQEDQKGMKRHGDAAISRCLAWFASNMNGSEIGDFQTGTPKSGRWDKATKDNEDQDNDYNYEGEGAW